MGSSVKNAGRKLRLQNDYEIDLNRSKTTGLILLDSLLQEVGDKNPASSTFRALRKQKDARWEKQWKDVGRSEPSNISREKELELRYC